MRKPVDDGVYNSTRRSRRTQPMPERPTHTPVSQHSKPEQTVPTSARRETQSVDYLYTMTDVVERTGLSRGQIMQLAELGLIEVPAGIGAGVKRFTEDSLQKLVEAAKLLRLNMNPRKVVNILVNQEDYQRKSAELIGAVVGIAEKPNVESAWENYATALLNIDGLSDEEKLILKYATSIVGKQSDVKLRDFAEQQGLSRVEARQILDRAYKKVGYAFVALMRLELLAHSDDPSSSE